MPWKANGDAQCDTCASDYPGWAGTSIGLSGRLETILRMRAAGWGFWNGKTNSGLTQVHIACPQCRREEHKRHSNISTIENQPLPGME